jgi:hypothetical protein
MQKVSGFRFQVSGNAALALMLAFVCLLPMTQQIGRALPPLMHIPNSDRREYLMPET